MSYSLPAATRLGAVTLKVSHLAQSIDFYTKVVGLHVLEERADKSAILGDSEQPIVILREIPAATRQPTRTTGLYHAAILLPTRRALATLVKHWIEIEQPFGYADHLVSEAFYTSDLDGNGLELYRDRPRSEWPLKNDKLVMDNAPIDFNSLFAELNGDGAWNGVPRGTTLGHMHLRVGDIATAEKFYHGLLGFDIVMPWHGALFVSAGGYHHHIGMNVWQSLNAPPAPPNSVGLDEFTVVLPSVADVDTLANRLQDSGTAFERADNGLTVNDPFSNRVRIVGASR